MATAIMTTTTAITTATATATAATTMESILENGGGGAPEEGGRVLGNRETTTSSINNNIVRQKTACLVISCIGLVIGASVYTFPTFTKSLLEQGLVDADVTVLGAVTQFSLAVGVVTRSILENYNINDMILAGGFTSLEAIACFMIAIVSNVPTSAPPINVNTRFGIYLISWIMIGAGLGGQFNHALLLQKIHYGLDPKKRSTSLSTVAFSVGFGALIWAVVIPYINNRYGMSVSFLFQGGALLLSLLRLPWQSRIVVDLSTPESTTTISTADRQEEEEEEEEERREPANFWIVIKDCFRDIPAFLIFITAFLNFGVSATMLSMLGVVAPHYTTSSNVDGADDVQLITASVTLTFLCCQCVSRAIIAKISWHKHVRQFSLAGIALLGVMGSLVGLLSSPSSSSASSVSTTTTATPLYVASALFGILFGWCWTILPVHVITFFPHQPQRYDVAFGAYALWAASLGTIAVTISSNFVVEAGSSSETTSNKDSLFVFFLSISGVSLLLGIISIGHLKEKQN